MYTLIMRNSQGASDKTQHETKAAIRRQIRTWDAKGMTCTVYNDKDGSVVYDGSALSF